MTGAAGAAAVEAAVAVVAATVVEGCGAEDVGAKGDDDMTERELADTKLVGARALSVRLRRLYGWKCSTRGGGGRRRRLATVAREKEAAHQGWRLGFGTADSSGSRQQ